MSLFPLAGGADRDPMNAISAVLGARRARVASAVDGKTFRLLVEHGPDTVFLLDLESEVCVYVSPAARDLLGRDPDELIGHHLTEFIHPDDAHEVLARSVRRREGAGVRTVVSRMWHADGRWVWVQATASPTLDWAGQTVAIFSVSGAAERVRAELGLRSARTRLRGVLARLGPEGDLRQSRDGTYDLTVEALAAALELRDDESCRHARRVTDLAVQLTAVVDPELGSDPELRYAYLLHDIGKIGIPDAILLKQDELTTRERRTLEMHTTLGEHLVSYIPFLSDLVHDVVAFHHEHWDGQGYPWGMSGAEIPLAARIFSVVDAFDAMTSDRPYRNALGIPTALEELERCAGTQFDPEIVSAFLPLGQRSAVREHSSFALNSD
jgi:PAS domain S-box-containing protein